MQTEGGFAGNRLHGTRAARGGSWAEAAWSAPGAEPQARAALRRQQTPLARCSWFHPDRLQGDGLSITITGQPGQRIAVAGDITKTLRVPYDEVEERFLLAASDGSLIEGRLEAEEDRFDFRVVVDGAGISRIGSGELTLDWAVEWVTIAPYDAGALTERGPMSLPLFDSLSG